MRRHAIIKLARYAVVTTAMAALVGASSAWYSPRHLPTHPPLRTAQTGASRAALPVPTTPSADSVVQRWMAEHHLPGVAVAVIRDGTPVVARGYGTRDLAGTERVTPDTPFQIASITKSLTAVAVMQLVQSGRVALDDSISRHLPNLPAAWRPITVRQLLSHTSGLPSISAFDSPPCNPGKTATEYQRGDVLREVSCLPLEFAPGEKWSYGDTGYYLLGMLLSAVSGKPYDEHMASYVFGPAGMNATRVQRRQPLPGVAEPVRWRNGQYERVETLDPMVDEANGAIVSTVLDLARWDAALDAHTLIKESTRGLMWTPATLRDGVAPYGYGFGLTPFGSHRRVGHTGGGPGCATAFAKYPDDRLTVIVLARGELPGGAVQRFANEIARVYLE